MSDHNVPLPRVPHLLDDDADRGDASSLVRAALRGARADVPDAARMEALSASIAGAIGGGGASGGGGEPGGDGGAGGAGAGPGGGAGAGAGAMGATKLAIGGVAVVAAIGVALLAGRSGVAVEAPVADGAASAQARSATASASATATATASSSATATASASTAVLDVHSLPAAPALEAGRATAPAPVRPTGSPEAEMALLRSAQDALASAPGDALARCEEHARSFSGGVLAEEREVIAVDALIRLGRRSEAEARATRFRAAHPGSAYVRRLDTLLGRPD